MDTSAAPEFRGTSRFVIERRLGEGGMGIVYLARDVERGMLVALKTLNRLDAVGLSSLKNEFRSLTGVVHPNLVTLHELISEDGHWFLTMEVVHGVSFSSWVQASPTGVPGASTPTPDFSAEASPEMETKTTSRLVAPVELSPEQASAPSPRRRAPAPWCDLERLRAALPQLVEGVLAIHDSGKLHRDLKPSNVLVTESGRVVILDFGLAIARDLRGARHAGGTPAYMAPEQLFTDELTPAADWYAVGTMIYLALTGHLPFSGSSSAILRAKRTRAARPPSTLVDGIPEDLEQLCMDCLHQDPAQRPSGRELLRRLEGGAGRAAPEPEASEATLFLGREQQLAQLHQSFEAAQQGRAVTVYVSGRSGMGKSALIHHFLDELRERKEAMVLTGRCYERESVPYKAWDSLIDSLVVRIDELPTPQLESLLPDNIQELARVFPVLRGLGINPVEQLAPGEHLSESRQRAFDALKELLRRLAQRQPLVLYIDDLQWGDSDSARLMAGLLSPPAPPLLLLCNYRSEEEDSSEFFRALQELGESGGMKLGEVRRIDVDRLSPEDGARLARALLGPGMAGSGEIPALIAREADGSPFFIAEFARHVRAQEQSQNETALHGLSLENVLLHRVRQQPREAQRLLEILSVAARPLEQGLAASAAELGPDATAALGTLRAANLIRTHGAKAKDLAEPYHDRIRETVAAAMDEARLRDCHRRLAAVLEANGDSDPEILAAHLEGAGETARATRYALLAAERAEAALAFDRAARLYKRTLAWAEPSQQPQLRLRLANALINAGQGAEAAPLLLAAAEGQADAEAAELRRRAVEQFLVSGYIDEGTQVLRDVLTGVGIRYPETTTRAVLEVLARLVRLRLRGMRFHERAASKIPPEQLLRIDVCYSAGKGLVLVDPIRGFGFLTQELLLALKSGEPRRVALGLCHYATNLGTAGQAAYPRATQLLSQAHTIGERLDDPFVLGTAGNCQAAVEMCAGHWKATVDRVTRANDILRQRCNGAWWEINSGIVFTHVALSALGRLRELTGLIQSQVRIALDRGDLFAATSARLQLWYAPLAADDVSQAGAEIREAIGRWPQRGFGVNHFWALYGETQCELYAGNGAAALERLAQAWPMLASSTILRIQFLRILITLQRGTAAVAAAHARQGDPQQLLRAAEKDASRLSKERTGWADAAASLLRASILGARGRTEEALRHLGEAIRGFDAADMALHAACARQRKGQLLGGDEGQRLMEAADATMREQSIQHPARWTALYAPGFSDGPRT